MLQKAHNTLHGGHQIELTNIEMVLVYFMGVGVALKIGGIMEDIVIVLFKIVTILGMAPKSHQLPHIMKNVIVE